MYDPATVPCQACRRPITVCAGEAICEGAARAQANPYPLEPLEPYKVGNADPDYRADALSRDPSCVSSLERMSGSFRLAYVVRNEHGTQLSHSPREACAWAGASGFTKNRKYPEWRAAGMEKVEVKS